MELRPRELCFWPTYGLVFAGCVLFTLSLLPMMYLTVGPFPEGFIPQFMEKFVQCALGFLVLSPVLAWALVRIRKRERASHWHVDDNHVEIYRNSSLVDSVSWTKVTKVFFVKGTMVLAVHGEWRRHHLPGMTRKEFRKVKSFHQATVAASGMNGRL